MEVSLIAALTRKTRIIGSTTGHIPWDLPRDKAHFRAYTQHKPILLGRKTFEEMENWFTTQHPIFVLTSDPNYTPHTPATIIPSIPDAIALTKSQNHPELVIAGGAAVFQSALPFATKLVLTWIETEATESPKFAPVSLPLHFPKFDPIRWQVTHTESCSPNPKNAYPMTLEILTLQ